jgi:KipI family sensor histidine kinase inhibitor
VIRPFGESALLVELDAPDRARAVAVSLAAARIPGVVELVPALRSVLVEVDPGAFTPDLAGRIEAAVATAADVDLPIGRRRTIPVVYGGVHGPDLDEVARLCGLAAEELVERHASLELRALFGGFAPGFAYLGEMPESLRVPRLATPRTRTPVGSVAVADGMSAIYPADLPGGWRVIGRTPLAMFDARRDPPSYLVAGDTVRFQPIDASAWDDHARVAEDWG